MFSLRPVGYVIGLMVLALGVFMIPPALVDAFDGRPDWRGFVVSAVFTLLFGGALTLGCQRGGRDGLSLPQAFLLVVATWVALPVFGALPFLLGEVQTSVIDALFEAVSGVTTTGSTIYVGLDRFPPGILLWRALLQWIGGVGVVVFAMVFLPSLQVGGMQIFRTEAFDIGEPTDSTVRTFTGRVFLVYVVLTLLCALVYGATGVGAFDALCHAMTTIATGGFANSDSSFAVLPPMAQYVAVFFMIAASLPFVLYVNMLFEKKRWQLFSDPQVKGFLWVMAVAWLSLAAVRIFIADTDAEIAIRQTLFNSVSILTGTGYSSTDYTRWGAFAIIVFFMIGLIGGCAGSTCCSVKIFRYQVLAAVALGELQKIRRPRSIVILRYGGRRLDDRIVTSVMTFMSMFFLTLFIMTAILTIIGLDVTTALSGAATALANIGPGLGETIGPLGSFADLPDSAKIVLITGMILGRLELLSVLVLFTPGFWRR